MEALVVATHYLFISSVYVLVERPICYAVSRIQIHVVMYWHLPFFHYRHLQVGLICDMVPGKNSFVSCFRIILIKVPLPF